MAANDLICTTYVDPPLSLISPLRHVIRASVTYLHAAHENVTQTSNDHEPYRDLSHNSNAETSIIIVAFHETVVWLKYVTYIHAICATSSDYYLVAIMASKSLWATSRTESLTPINRHNRFGLQRMIREPSFYIILTSHHVCKNINSKTSNYVTSTAILKSALTCQ